jgi:hypothetical protein
MSEVRTRQELYMAAGLRGVGRSGADFWNIPSAKTNARGATGTIIGMYAEWGRTSMGNSTHAFLAPGADGPISTARLETMHECSQETEARVLIEKALLGSKDRLAIGGQAPAEACRRFQDMLDRRIRIFLAYCVPSGGGYGSVGEWYQASNWEDRTREIYEAASQVAKATGGTTP